jgi:signal transduction histidine kinase
MADFSEPLNAANYIACLVGLVLRYRRGGERQRRQLWLALALLAMLVMLAIWVPSSTSGPLVLVLLVIPLVPASITIAVLRHNLLDIRLVFTRALLYGLLTGGAIITYLWVVALADLAVGRHIGEGGQVLASLVVAVAFNPVRVRLQRGIDSLFYGDRSDPVRAVSRLGTHLAHRHATTDPRDALAVVADALRLPYAALRVDHDLTAAHGSPTSTLETVPLTFSGDRVGDLIVGVRSGQGELSASDRAVLELLAAPLAVAVRATSLSEAVQRSREQLVNAREEERRRLRRDLHDGLGPALTGVAFSADAARNLLRTDPDRADTLLADLRARTTEAIDDIRRLVYALRPPSLDELGLVGALNRQAEHLSSDAATVAVVAPADPPTLPAAVEVAAFRIAVEALTNAVRHSRASRIEVRLAIADTLELTVTVTDNGTTAHTWQPGIGLTSMRERAAELGGLLEAGADSTGGRVHAKLPL